MSLINREKLLAHFAWWPDADENKGVFQAIIARQPDVDAVEVVRCRDCKHSKLDIGGRPRWCNVPPNHTMKVRIVSDDWYCADGERKEPSDGR